MERIVCTQGGLGLYQFPWLDFRSASIPLDTVPETLATASKVIVGHKAGQNVSPGRFPMGEMAIVAILMIIVVVTAVYYRGPGHCPLHVLSFFFFFLFTATPVAYGSSQLGVELALQLRPMP